MSQGSYTAPQFKVRNWFWYPSLLGLYGLGTGATTGVAGRVFVTAVPIPLSASVSRATIRVNVAGGAGTKLRIGAYADNGNTPTGAALLFDSGDIAADSVGVKIVILSVPVVVAGGFVWLVLETQDATVQFNRYSANPSWVEVTGENLIGGFFDRVGGYGALPLVCPAITPASADNMVCSIRADNLIS